MKNKGYASQIAAGLVIGGIIADIVKDINGLRTLRTEIDDILR